MQYRKFGNTDLVVSEVGFGAWAIGGGALVGETAIGWGDADDNESIAAIHASLDKGITFFDTADIYGLGHSEELLGKNLPSGNNIVVATKVGNVAREGKFGVDYSKKYILNACEESLRRLRRDVIDYYQLHSARLTDLQDGECVDAMQQLQKEGKIRYWGLSLNTFDPGADAQYLVAEKMGNGFQLVLNIINQKALQTMQLAAENGFGIIARMPLQFGLLTGKFDNGASFATNDHRKNRLTETVIAASNAALDPVWKLCEKYQCTKTQLALSYVLSYDAVSTIIPGIRNAKQAELNTSGLFKLDAGDRKMIEMKGENEMLGVMELIKKQG